MHGETLKFRHLMFINFLFPKIVPFMKRRGKIF